MDLRANTAVDVLIGPFVDDSDGNTAETALTISQADVRLSKNGQNMAQKSDGTACVHDELGYFNCELDSTDTNTEGILTLCVHESGALPVRHEYGVLAEAAWDSLYVAKDDGFMDVNIKTVGRADTQETEANNFESACSNYSATRGLTGTALPAAAADAAGGVPVSDAGGLDLDAMNTNINDIETDTNELQTDDVPGLIAALNDPTAAAIADAVWDEASAGHTDAGKAGQQLWIDLDAVLADTNELQADDTPGTLSTIEGKIDNIEADTNELQTDDVPTLIAALPTAVEIQAEMEENGASILDTISDKLPTNYIMGSSDQTDQDDDIAAILADTNELQTDDIPTTLAGLNDISTAEVNTQVDTALADINLDHLVGTAAGIPSVPAGTFLDQLLDDGTAAFDRTTDSLQAIRDRGDSAWITGGGGGITDILNVVPLIPRSIDLANTASWRLGLMLMNALDDLPTTGEIDPGTIDIDRKAVGGTSWSSIISGGACSEVAGMVYYDEVFDSGTGYLAGDSIRVTFKSQKITVAANDYEISDANGRIFYTDIRESMRGTDSAALASVCTEGRLGELDAGNLPSDIDDILADTNELQADDTPAAIAALNDPTAAAIADAVWDEAKAGHVGAGSMGEEIQSHALESVCTEGRLAELDAANLPSDLDDVLADTNELQADDIPGTLSTIAGYIDTEIGDIQSRLPAALVSGRMSSDAVAISGSTAAADNVEANIGNLDAAVSGVETDTQDIQSRLPAALVSGRMSSDAVAISGSTDAADKLEASAETVVTGAAIAGTLSTTQMTTNLTEVTDDHYNGRILVWTSGVLKDQASDITDYDGGTKMLSYTAVTEAPSATDTFVIV